MNFSLIREDKELLIKPHLGNQVRLIIRKMKEHVAEVAVRNGTSVRIRPSGEVIFGDVLQILNQTNADVLLSGQVSITLMDITGSHPPTLAPHR